MENFSLSRSNKPVKYKGDIIADVIFTVLLIIVGLIIFIPILHIVCSSISDPENIRTYNGLVLFPRGFNLGGYKIVFTNPALLNSVKNTFVYLIIGTIINMVTTIVCAYVLSFKEPMLNRLFTILITITMFFSGGLIPLYTLLRNMNLTNTFWAVIIPGAMNAWNMIILRTAFRSVPNSLLDAAKIDGASYITMLLKVVLPLTIPTLAIIFMYYVSGHWNSWFSYLVFIDDQEKYPLQLILRKILVQNDTKIIMESAPDAEEIMNNSILVQYSVSIVSVLPMLLFFPFVQKYFLTGVLVGSLKE